jgi:CheY-like chemotaxis protein
MFKTNKNYIKDNMVIKKIKFNILIIDENINNFDLFKSILELKGHSVKIITETINCVCEIGKNNYDIIFIDHNSCKIADIMITDLLRNVLNYNALIFAYSNKKDETLKKLDVDGIIIKPHDIISINKILKLFETIQIIDNQYILNKKVVDSSLIFFNKK